MARELYLHETVDIVGDGAIPYMEQSVVGFDPAAIANRGLELYGTWYVQGSTGRWPQVVNIWQLVDGWAGWQKLAVATNLRRRTNQPLDSWWKQAATWRSGGVDRLLGAMPGSQSLKDVRRRGLRGEVFLHELSQVLPGRGPEYLRAIVEEWAPVMTEYGHELVGAWEVLMRDTEVCVLWATQLEHHVGLQKAADAARGFEWAGAAADDRIVAWRARARDFCVAWREEILIPCPGTPMGPAEWRE